ncbi:hypothetical protein B0H13DRAFT_2266455 [Mycena leptocephala]|nr:hypothetical protein B0H13DRAFT_2266455 [Mycena leptocephala]
MYMQQLVLMSKVPVGRPSDSKLPPNVSNSIAYDRMGYREQETNKNTPAPPTYTHPSAPPRVRYRFLVKKRGYGGGFVKSDGGKEGREGGKAGRIGYKSDTGIKLGKTESGDKGRRRGREKSSPQSAAVNESEMPLKPPQKPLIDASGAGRGLISGVGEAGEFQNVIQSREYSGLDPAEGCKGEEDSRCYGKSGIEDGEGRIKGEERKHDRCIIHAREMPGNTGRGERGGCARTLVLAGHETQREGRRDGVLDGSRSISTRVSEPGIWSREFLVDTRGGCTEKRSGQPVETPKNSALCPKLCPSSSLLRVRTPQLLVKWTATELGDMMTAQSLSKRPQGGGTN